MLADLSILWVDDDLDLVEVLARRFRRQGARVRICASAEACLSAVDDERPDVVVTDRMLEGYDGLRLVSRLKELSPDLVVVMLSGYSDEVSVRHALNSGVDEFLAKPVPLLKLEEVLSRYSVTALVS
jgi:DNA-binding response OmpR family regulator